MTTETKGFLDVLKHCFECKRARDDLRWVHVTRSWMSQSPEAEARGDDRPDVMNTGTRPELVCGECAAALTRDGSAG